MLPSAPMLCGQANALTLLSTEVPNRASFDTKVIEGDRS